MKRDDHRADHRKAEGSCRLSEKVYLRVMRGSNMSSMHGMLFMVLPSTDSILYALSSDSESCRRFGTVGTVMAEVRVQQAGSSMEMEAVGLWAGATGRFISNTLSLDYKSRNRIQIPRAADWYRKPEEDEQSVRQWHWKSGIRWSISNRFG